MSAVDDVRKWVVDGGPIGTATVRMVLRDLLAERDQLAAQLETGGAEWSRMAEQHDALVGEVAGLRETLRLRSEAARQRCWCGLRAGGGSVSTDTERLAWLERETQRVLDERDRLAERLRLRSEALDRVVAENEQLRARLVAAQALHKPVDALHTPTGKRMQVCSGCERDGDWRVWPCPTAAALAGEGS